MFIPELKQIGSSIRKFFKLETHQAKKSLKRLEHRGAKLPVVKHWHKHLHDSNNWYRRWHEYPFHSHVHWLALAFSIGLLIKLVVFPDFAAVDAAGVRVQTVAAGNANATTVSATWPSATTTGNLLVAIVGTRGGAGLTITPPAGGWTQAVRSDNTDISSVIYYIENAASQSGASTWTLSATERATLTLAEYSGMATSGALDVTGSASGTGTSVDSGTTATTTQADAVAIAGISIARGNTTFSAQTNGYTEVSEVASVGGGQNNRNNTVFEEKILSATAAESVQATASDNRDWAGAIAVFKATPPATPTFEQEAYRIYNNTDSADVGSALAAQNTAAVLASDGDAFRVRSLVNVDTANLATSSQDFKLQYAIQSGSCDVGFSGETYADVTAATPIAYNDNATPGDGINLIGNANDPTSANTIVDQTYEELNNFTNSSAINATESGLWDFSLIDNTAPAGTTYCLRIVEDDGTPLDTYTQIPEVTTAGTLAVINWSQCRVEGGTTTIPASQNSSDLTLSTGITDTTKAFLLADSSGVTDIAGGDDHMVSGYILDANTLRFERGASPTTQAEVSYALVECFNDEFTVQRGEITLDAAEAIDTDTITAVDTSKSMVIVNSRTLDTASAEDEALATGELTDSTTIQVERANSTNETNVRYEVVEFSTDSGVTIQTNEVTLGSGSASVTDTISAVNTGESFLYCSWDATNNGLQQTAIGCDLTNSTTVTFHRHATGAYTNRIRYYVIDFNSTDVIAQRGSVIGNDPATSPTDVDIPITAIGSVDKAFPFITNTTSGTGTAFPRNKWIEYLTSTTNLRTTFWNFAGGTADINNKYWQVIEFFTPPNTEPTGSFNSTTGSTGDITVSIEIDDVDDNDTKALIEYETDSDGLCNGPWAAATLSGPATADFDDSGGAPDVNNANPYQIGTTATTRIITSSGSNTVDFTWNSATDLPLATGTQCLRLTANDDLADQVTPDTITLTVNNLVQIDQSAYRWFANDDSTDVGTTLAAQDTAIQLTKHNQEFRLRMLLEPDVALNPGDKDFKLQFSERGTDGVCDASFTGETYVDVTAATVLAYNDNITPADADSLITNANDPTNTGTTINQSYEELNNFAISSAINIGEDGMWDFSLINNGAVRGAHYCFRAVEDTGAVFTNYTVFPEIQTRPDFYMVCDDQEDLFIINHITGIKELVGATGVPSIEAIAFDSATDTLYTANGGSFGTLSLTNGAYTDIDEIDNGSCADGADGCVQLDDVDGLALDPLTRIMWASNRRGSDFDMLFQIDTTTGQFIPDAFGTNVDYLEIDGTGVYDLIDDIAIRPTDGVMFTIGNDGVSDQLLRINKTTGVVTVETAVVATDVEGLDYSNDGELWGTRGFADELVQINDTTGATISTFDLTPDCSDAEALTSLTSPANIVSGTVYDDLDQAADKDPLEPGLPNVTVKMYIDNNNNGTIEVTDLLVQTTTTDANGEYNFYIHTTANLVLEIDTNTLPAGYALTTDNLEAANFTDAVNFGETDENNDFGATTGSDCDSDGIPDFIEGLTDSDGDGIPNQCDMDSDNDGIPDADEFTNDIDFDGIPNYLDLDSDNDGIPDALEANNGAAPTGYSSSTGRISGVDADADGLVDSVDTLPGVQYGASTTTLPVPDNDGDGMQDYLDRDSDADGLLDVVEAGGTDADIEGGIDSFVDVNGDGYHDPLTTTPLAVANSDSTYETSNGLPLRPDYIDRDADADGIADRFEGYATGSFTNPVINNDVDGDGIIDFYDIDQGGTPITPVDSDGDGTPDFQDTDSDDDGVLDEIEGNDANQNGVKDTTPTGIDADGDGIDSAFDNDDSTYGDGTNVAIQNTDGTDEVDFRDTNDDNDGFLTINEDFNTNNDWSDDFTQGGSPTPDYLFFTQPVDLEVTKTVDVSNPNPGDTITYTITIENNGPITATLIEVTDILPAGVTYTGDTPSQGTYTSGTGVWDVGTLTFTSTATLDITATVDLGTGGSTIINTATRTANLQGDTTPGNDSDDASITVRSADLSVAKVVDDASPDEGDTIVYTITVTNNGPDNASNIFVADSLPAGVTYVSDVPSQGSYTSGTGQWNVGSISNGANATLAITATVDGGTAGDAIINTASISSLTEEDPTPGNDSDSASLTVNAVDLAVAKVVDDASPDEGDTIIYTITVSNSGPSDATNVSITDSLPVGVTYVSDTPSQGSYVSGTGVWTVGTINNAANATLAITATVDGGTAGNTINNSASVTAVDQFDTDAGNDSDNVDIIVKAVDLEVAKVVDNATPGEGDTIIYTITVTNNGPSDATTVEITDLLPAGVTYVSDTPSQGSYVSGTGVWTVGTINNAASATLAITATVDGGTQGSTINNTATVTNVDQTDTVPGNDSDTAAIVVSEADLSVAKVVDNATPGEGDTIIYTITVTNNGPDDTTGVEITDSLPTGVTYVSDTPSQGTYVSGTGVWTVGTINNGANATLAITATVDGGTTGNTINNIASVTASDAPDPTPGNDSDNAQIVVSDADLAITKVVDNASPEEGESIIYTVTVTNNGPDDATGIQVTDSLPAGVTYVSDTPSQGSYVSGTGVWTVGALTNGANATLAITATVDGGTAGTTINNSASVTASDQPDNTPGNNSDDVDIDVSSADLSINKVVNDATPDEGDTITYTITVTNNGPDNATGVEISDSLPAGVTYTGDTPSQGSYVSGTGVWTVGAINNGANATLTITATVDAATAGSTINNTATVTASDQSDPTPGNNSDSEAITVTDADLAVTKVVDDNNPNEGDTITYTITVTNNGPDDTTGVQITDALPAGITYTGDTPSQGSYVSGTGVWTVGALTNGANATLAITATVDGGTAGTTINNTATVTASDQSDSDSGNNSDSIGLTVESIDLVVAKVVDDSAPEEGDTITYTITVTNNGPADATGVEITDSLPAGVTYTGDTPSQGSYVSGTGVWTVGSITNGANATLAITATVDGGTAGTTINNTATLTDSDQVDTNGGNDTDSASITVVSIDLAVTKVVDDATPDEGNTITYTITVANSGPDDATGVEITDLLPAGVTYTGDTPSQGSYVNGTGVWTVGSINNGANATLAITATVDGGTAGTTINNTATLTDVDQVDTNIANNSDTAGITVTDADLAVTKVVDDATPNEGDTIVYTITITNNGPDDATGIQLTDSLPAGVTYVSDTPSQGTYVSGTGIWTVGSITNGGNATLAITATVDGGTGGSTINNTATITASDQGDTTPGNNSDSASINVETADLELAKFVNNATPNVGDTITYTLSLSNNGPSDATGIQVTDLLPAGVTYTGDTPSQGTYVSGTGIWTVGAVTNGGSATLAITATVDAGTEGTTINNSAEITASDQGDPDSTPGNASGIEDDEAAASITVNNADLSVTKVVDNATPDEGNTITYTITITNNGPTDATGVQLTDSLPAGLTYTGDTPSQGTYVSGTGIWTVGAINNGANATLAITATVDASTAGSTINNTATITASDQSDGTPGNNSDSASLTVTNADLSVTKVVDDATPDEGNTITYTITVTNNGPDDTTGVQITDSLPAGVTYTGDTPSQGTYVNGTGIWTVGALTNGANATLAITATVDGGTAGTTINNTATVTASDQSDSDAGNNTDSASLTVTDSDLAVTKVVDNATPDEGDTITYTITVTNNGPDDTTGVQITDSLPAGVTYTGDTPSQGTYVSGTGIWTVGALTNGANATLAITATVDAATAGTTINNTATVTASDQSDSTPGNNTDSASVTVTDADLAVTKVVDNATPDEGDTITYTITIDNNGPDDATGVELTDLIPAGLTFTGSTPSQGAYVSGTGVWTVGAITNGADATLTITATVDPATAGSTINNTATITNSDQGDSVAGNNSDSASLTVTDADLAVTKVVDNATPDEGDTITYTITVTNNGPDDTTGVQITDALPAGVTYTGDTPSQGTYVSGTGVWTVGALTNGANATLAITATVDASTAGTTINNTATITASDQSDSDTGNNTDSASITVTDADLALTKVVDNATPDEGDTITYTITVTNNGPDDTTGVQITDALPAGVTYTGDTPSQGTYVSGTGVWTVGAITNGANATLAITATVDAATAGTTINNTATITASDQSDSDTGNNTDSASVTVTDADLAVTKVVDNATPDEGDTITYTITVTNNGPDDTTGVTVSDLIPAGLTYTGDTPSQGTYVNGTGVWTVGSITNGANATLAITATVDAGTAGATINNTATITASDQSDSDSGNNTDSASLTVTDADLAVTKVVDNATPDEGDTITYTITVTNNGPDDTTGVQITDSLPAGVTYTGDTPSQGTYVSGTGVWTVGSLTNGANATLAITATVDAATAGSTINNTATITASDQSDSDTGNNTDSASVTVIDADLAVTKVVDNATPDEGDTITYTITIDNNGPDNATGVVLTDTLPAGVTYTGDTPSQGTYVSGTGIWTVGSIANGADATLTITATVDAATAGTTINNTATITASDQSDSDAGNNSDSASLTVTDADLAVTKVVDNATPDEGNTITYTITVTNNGPDDTTGVQITDSLPAGVTYTGDTPSQGTYVSGTGIWTVGALTNGANATLAITATVDAATAGTTINNTATITASDQSDSDAGNNTDSASLTVTDADLAVTKVVDNATPDEGDTITYTITVTNNGPDDTTGVQITDSLPAGVTYTGDTPSQGAYNDGTGVWTVGALTNGANATLAITATVDAATAGTTINNTATITASDQSDSDAGNNTDSASLTVTDADLAVTKVVDNATPDEGDTITYTITVTNNGPDDTTGVQITDSLPAGVTYTGDTPSQGTYNDGTGLWTVGSLTNGANATLAITATVDASTAGDTINNTATVTASDQSDSDAGNNSDSASVTVTDADLAVTKVVDNATPDEGDTITYTITVTNNGPDDTTGVTISDLIPAGLTYTGDTPSQGTYNDGTGIWTVGALTNGANATLAITATVDAATAGSTINNTATITASDQSDSNAANNTDSASLTVTDADLAVTKVVDDATPEEGDTITYTITVTNNGPDDTTGVQITDSLPAGVTYTGDTPSQGTYVSGTGVWTVGSLTNGANATLVITATVDAATAGTTINNTATVTASDQSDSDAGNNTDSASITVVNADLEVTKVVNDATPEEGDTITYTVTITNNGQSDATGVTLTDSLPAGVTYTGDTPSQGSYVSGTGLWTVGSIANGANATLAITATVDPGTAATTIINTATITSSDQDDNTPGNNSDSASLTVQATDLEIAKVVNDATPEEGDTITYTITITNNGPDDNTGIQVTDALPAGVTYTGDTPSQGTYNDGTGLWTVGALTNGANATLAITATVDAATAGSTINNTATITASDKVDTNLANNSDSAAITVINADLAVTKVVDNATPNEGDTITYTVTVTNNGADNATGVQITDSLPAGVTYTGDTPSQGTYVSGTGVWTVGALTNGANATLAITATVDAATSGTTINNTATITASDQADSNAGNNSDSASVTVNDADLAVTKVVDDATPNEGDTITYTITVTNNGPTDATGVQITDSLPAGVTYTGDTPSQGTYVSGTGIWTVGAISNGANATLAITATVDAATAGDTINNTATITASDQSDSDAGNNTDSASLTVTDADLAVTKVVDNATPDEGDTVTYTITIDNNGSDNATGVTLSDLIPAGLTYTGDTPSQGSYVNGTGVWTVGAINNGADATLAITATVDAATAGSTINNTATITASDQSDSDPGNNSDSASLTVTDADLAVTKVVDNANPDEGNTVTYTITVTNNGPDDTTGVQITDALPSGVTYTGDTPSQGTYVSGTGIWTVGALTNGANATLAITATVDASTAGSTINNTATITASDQSDSDSGNNTDSASLTVQSIDLSLTKVIDDATPDEGDTVTYTITVTNNGPNDSTGVQVTDALPSGVTYTGDTPSQGTYVSGTGIWTVGSITNGANATLTITATVDAATAGDTINNTATITALDQFDSNAANDSDSASLTVIDADLAVVKVVDNATPNEGDTVTYTVTVTNNGADNATGVQLTDSLPAGVTYTGDTPSQGSYVSGTGIWTVGSITNGANATLTITATVDAATAGDIINNTATLTASDQSDSDAGNNSDSASLTVTDADLAVVKVVDDATPNEGDTITYTVTVTNNGPDNATGVQITDSLPAGVTYTGDTPSQGSYVSGTGVWTVGALANGANATLAITATVDAATAGTTINNTATVTDVDQGDSDPGNNNDSASILVNAVDLAVTKVIDDATPDEGDTVTYTITVTNNGPDDATGIELTDSLPAGITYTGDTPSQGSYVSGTGVWTVGSLTNAANATLTITATVDASTSGTTIINTATITDLVQTDANAANDSDSATLTVIDADLAVTKVIDDATPNEGDNINYTVTVTNNGPDDATGVQLTDLIPAGLTYAGDTPSQGSYVSGTGVWTIGSINNGANATLTITATVDAATAGTTINNTATITATDQSESDTANNTDSASLTVKAVDLAVTKIVDNATPDEDDTVTYTITVTNNGPDAATSIELTDSVPAGVTYTGDTPSQGSYVSGTGVWTVGTIANGANATLAITATVDASTSGTTINNTATITNVTETDTNAANDTDSASLTVTDADLAVTKVVNDSTPDEGDTITYTITVTNNGPDDTTGVTLTDALPAGVTYTGDTPSQGSYVSGTGVWTVGSLTNGANATLAITATVNASTAGTTINNTATLTASDQSDSDSGNNTDSASLTVTDADLAVTKVVDNATPNVGDTITYTITVTNDGPDDTTGVTLSDLIPTGLTYTGDTPSQGSYVSGTGVWTIGAITNGANATLAITATVDAATAGSTINNTATITASDQSDSDPANNSDSASLTVTDADLAVTKVVDDATPIEGDTVTYTLTVTNNGPDDTTNVQITDALPAGVTYTGDTPSQGSYVSGTGVWTVGSLTNGANATLAIAATVDAATAGSTINNTATVTGSDQSDSDPANNTDDADITVGATGVDLTVSKAVDNPTPNEADTIIYTITLTNNGPNTATSIELTDSLPAGVTYVSDTPSQGTYVNGTGIWTVGTINNGANATLAITATVDAATAGSAITNTATITNLAEVDTDGTNDSDDAVINVDTDQIDLEVAKFASPSSIKTNEAVSYSVTVINNGPDAATSVELTDILSTDLAYVSDTPSQGTYNNTTGIWTIGTIAATDSASLTINATVTAAAGTTINNTAQISAATETDTDSTPANSITSEDDLAQASFVVQSPSTTTPPTGGGGGGGGRPVPPSSINTTNNTTSSNSNPRIPSCFEYDPDRQIAFEDVNQFVDSSPMIDVLKDTRIISTGDYIYSGTSNHSTGKQQQKFQQGVWQFQPNRNVTRLEVVKTVLVANCIPIENTIPVPNNGFEFSDLPTNVDPSDEVNNFAARVFYTAVKHGVVTGYGDTKASPFIPATNSEIIALAMRAAGVVTIQDQQQADVWFQPAKNAAIANGIYNDINAGDLDPLNRADFTKVLVRSMALSRNNLVSEYIAQFDFSQFRPGEVLVFDNLPIFEAPGTTPVAVTETEEDEPVQPEAPQAEEPATPTESEPASDQPEQQYDDDDEDRIQVASCLEYDPERIVEFNDLGETTDKVAMIDVFKDTRIYATGDYIYSGTNNHSTGKQQQKFQAGTWEFQPERVLTRLELVKTALVANCIPIENTVPAPENGFQFTDLPTTVALSDEARNFAARVFYTAVKNNVILGVGEKQARPFQVPTDAEVVDIALRAAGYTSVASQALILSSSEFSDIVITKYEPMTREYFTKVMARSMMVSSKELVRDYISQFDFDNFEPNDPVVFKGLPRFIGTIPEGFVAPSQDGIADLEQAEPTEVIELDQIALEDISDFLPSAPEQIPQPVPLPADCFVEAPFTRFLTTGTVNSEVVQLQELLQCLGYFPDNIEPNGVFGPTTINSVVEFQQENGLAAPGYVGPETRAVLNEYVF